MQGMMELGMVVLAQAAGSGAPAAGGGYTDAATVHSVWDFVVKGGIVMIPIGACSLACVALLAERAWSLRAAKVNPPGFRDGLVAALGAGGAAGALAYCGQHPCPAARVAEAALKRWNQPLEQVEKHIAEAGQREAVGLRKYLRGLSVIAAVSPLLGLLGTIFGMIKAFQIVAASSEALGRTELLAGGIYEAMITTAAGLIVAIPATLGYHALAARVASHVMDLDAWCLDLAERRRLPSPPVGVVEVATPGVATPSLDPVAVVA